MPFTGHYLRFWIILLLGLAALIGAFLFFSWLGPIG